MNRRILLLAFLVCAIFVGSAGTAYWFTCKNTPEQRETVKEREVELPQTWKASTHETVISKDAEMVYQYYYTQDGVTKEQVEPVQDFLQGLSLRQIKSIYHDWQVVSFASDRVILRSNIDGRSDASFILGEKEGFLAVFQEDAQNRLVLYETTDIPLSALPQTEQQQLKEGIRILGEEGLAKMLSDYGS